MLELSFPALSVEEYLACEQKGDVRHEYVNGYMYALAGASQRHSRIAGNIFAAFWALAQAKPCRIHQNDMELRTSESVFYYPDVMAVCGKPEPDPFYETEPCVLVEVLSPSTKDTDLREKLVAYKSLPSVQTYLIVEAARLAVRRFWADAGGRWQQEDLTGDGDIPLPYLGGVLSLPQIYRGVF
jgi:Uma2 family endonuclease